MSEQSHSELPYAQLIEALRDETVIFQDVLNAGYELDKVEAFGDAMNARGIVPVTIGALVRPDLLSDPDYGLMAQRTLPFTLGRLREEL